MSQLSSLFTSNDELITYYVVACLLVDIFKQYITFGRDHTQTLPYRIVSEFDVVYQ